MFTAYAVDYTNRTNSSDQINVFCFPLRLEECDIDLHIQDNGDYVASLNNFGLDKLLDLKDLSKYKIRLYKIVNNNVPFSVHAFELLFNDTKTSVQYVNWDTYVRSRDVAVQYKNINLTNENNDTSEKIEVFIKTDFNFISDPNIRKNEVNCVNNDNVGTIIRSLVDELCVHVFNKESIDIPINIFNENSEFETEDDYDENFNPLHVAMQKIYEMYKSPSILNDINTMSDEQLATKYNRYLGNLL
jgi:hypothetical protein